MSGELASSWNTIKNEVLWCSWFSLAACVIILVHYVKTPDNRRTPGWLLMRAALCESIVSILFLVLYYLEARHDHRGLPRSPEDVQFTFLALISAAEVAANAWRLLMSGHLVIIYRNPFNPDRHRAKYCVFVLVTTGCTFAFTRGLGWWMRQSHENPKHVFIVVFSLGLYFIPFVLYVIVGSSLHFTVKMMIRTRQEEGSHASISFLSRERAMRVSEVYLLLHSMFQFMGVCLLGFLLFHWVHQESMEEDVWILLVFPTCLRGSISLFGWAWVNGCMQDTAVTVRDVARRISSSQEASGVSMTELPASGSARELAGGLGDGPSPRSSSGTRDASAEPPRLQPHHRRPTATLKGIEEHGFKKELRFELLYDVACSIGDCASRELLNSEDDDGTGSEPANAAMSMIVMGTDTRRSLLDAGVAVSDPRTIRALADQRRTADHSWYSRGAGYLAGQSCRREDSDEPLQGRAEHYSAGTFRQIRRWFGISPVVYAQAFPSDLSQNDSQWQQKLKESVSEGASGSFFYRVMSGSSSGVPSRFIVKQINAAEKRVLMNMLPAYERHVERRQGKSLIQYLGCHALTLRWKFSAQVYFVVMRNFLPVKMWFVFDLKGATANRRALSARRLHSQIDAVGNATEYGTLRDWEWMDAAMGVDVDAADKAELAEMIAEDAKFLAEQDLLDYSLLIGVHRLPSELSAAERDERIVQLRAVGGYPSIDRQKVYFFGIIDVLERYTWGWWAQTWVLTAYYHLCCKGKKANGISALKPVEYADRFNTFMQQEVLQMPQSPAPGISFNAHDAVKKFSSMFAGSRLLGNLRWGQLWKRRRRGLVTERIQAERSDYIKRIEELQAQLKALQQAQQAT